MTSLRARAVLAIVATLVAAVAWSVFRPAPEAGWLRVDAPAGVVVGEPFVATVTLREPADGMVLHFDLHAHDARRSPLRTFIAGTKQAVAAGQRSFRFTLLLSQPPGVARVEAIVYLSRTGQWSDAFRVARSDLLEVVAGRPGAGDAVAKPLRVHDDKEEPAIEVADPPAARVAIAVLWLAAGLVAGVHGRRRARGAAVDLFIVLCLALAAWEMLGAANAIADRVRLVARGAGLYEDRRIAQQLGTVALAAVVGLLAAIGLLRPVRRLPGLALAGIALYVAVSLAGLVSLHEVDRLLATAIGPWPLAGVLKLVGACAALAGAAGHRAGV